MTNFVFPHMILWPPHGIFTNMHCNFIKWEWIYLKLPSCVRIGVCVWRLLMELNIFKNIGMIIISCDNKNAINLSNNSMFQLLESSQFLNFFSKWCFASYTPIIIRLNCLHFTRSLGHKLIFKIFKVCSDSCAQTSSTPKKK